MQSPGAYDEKKLLHRLQYGDREAFQEIYQYYFPRLSAYVLKFIKAPQHTEDILQEVFIKLWEIRETIDPEKYFSGYIYTITKNLVFKFLKHAANTPEVTDEILISIATGVNAVDEIAEWKELQTAIHNAILLLPPKRQEVFLMCREENMSYDQASAKLGISRNTIKEHMVLAMKFIREHLKAQSVISISAPLLTLLAISV